MKIIQFLLLFFISYDGFCQSHQLFKTWIDKNNESLIITDSVVFTDIRHSGLFKSDYRLSNDTLFLIEYQWADTKQYPKETDYHIIKLTADSLFLVKNKKYLGELTGEKDTLILVDSVRVKSNITSFDKFLFQETHLSSVTIRKKLEIHKTGKVYFWDDLKDPSYYQMDLNKEQIDYLVMLINLSRIENFSVGPPVILIGPPTFTFTLNCENEVIRRTVHKAPYFNWPLFDYLYEIIESVMTIENKSKEHTFLD